MLFIVNISLCLEYTPQGYFLLLRCSGPTNYGSSPFQASRPSSCLQERPHAPCWALCFGLSGTFLKLFENTSPPEVKKNNMVVCIISSVPFHVKDQQVHLWFAILNMPWLPQSLMNQLLPINCTIFLGKSLHTFDLKGKCDWEWVLYSKICLYYVLFWVWSIQKINSLFFQRKICT